MKPLSVTCIFVCYCRYCWLCDTRDMYGSLWKSVRM